MNKVVKLTVNEHGNLSITVCDREELEEINQRDTYGEMKLHEALEYQLCNSCTAYTPDISDWGHLSNAPGIILEPLEYDEETGYPIDWKEIYWYPNYMVSDCWQVLLDTGSVTFIRA